MATSNIINLAERVPTWANIGEDVSKSNTLDEVIKTAGLDYEVTKKDLTVSGTDIVIPDKVATFREDTGKVMGVVSPKYQIVQNKEAFDFVNYINGDLQYVKAGQTEGGMVYIIGKLPDQYILDDQFTPYVIFRNSFNGRYPVQSAIVPLRIVCQNQFNMAFKHSDNTIAIRHSRNADIKMQEAQEVLRCTAEHMNTLNAFADNMASQKVSDVQFGKFIDNMFHIDEEEMAKRAITNIETDRASFLTAYNAPDNANFKGTKWGMINAFTDFQTHKPIQRKTATAEEQRFVSVAFDPVMMTQFMQKLNAVA